MSFLYGSNYVSAKCEGGLKYRFAFKGSAASKVADYLWDFGDGNTSAEASPLHTYAADGRYQVMVVLTDASGATARQGEVVWAESATQSDADRRAAEEAAKQAAAVTARVALESAGWIVDASDDLMPRIAAAVNRLDALAIWHASGVYVNAVVVETPRGWWIGDTFSEARPELGSLAGDGDGDRYMVPARWTQVGIREAVDYWPTCDTEPVPVSIVNLTPHALNIQREDGSTLTVAPSGTLARCAETREPRPAIAGLPVTLAGFGAVEGLPEPRAGVVYVVSALVLAQVQDRADVFAPGPAIRDDQGRIVGARGLSCTPVYEVRS